MVACVLGIVLQLPDQFLPQSGSSNIADVKWLAILVFSVALMMAPLDFWGGYWAPSRFGRQSVSLWGFVKSWSRGVLVQTLLFLVSSMVILTVGRQTGQSGATVGVLLMCVLYVGFQHRILSAMTSGVWQPGDDKVDRSLDRAESWGLKRLPVTVINIHDAGFTGGVIGLPRSESIVIPRDFVDQLTADQLAIVLARRMIAVESGGRTRGIVVALVWIVVGFTFAASLPGAGVTTVAELATTSLGFTLWTFLGLLSLPTLSRQSSYAIDGELLRRGAEQKTFTDTIRALDLVQDDEPSRGAVVETIFHPVPSVENRRQPQHSGVPLAWHAARMTLFLSWSCMGLLARAVHCNVGRPELWAMLPTD